MNYLAARNTLKGALVRARTENAEWQKDRDSVIDSIFNHNWQGDYLSLSEDSGLVSYFKSGGNHKDRWKSRCRIKTKFGKYITSRFVIDNGNVSDWACQISPVICKGEYKWHILRGDQIKEAYDDCVGGSSCMTDSDHEKTEIYWCNPDKVSLLVAEHEGEKVARALIWETDQGVRLMDRIYPNSGKHIGHYEKYARDNGIVQRPDNSHPSGQVFGDRYTVRLEFGDNKYVPYMDSFCWGEDEGCELFLSTRMREGENLRDTDGGPFRIDMLRCCNCDCKIDEDDSHTYDGDCYCSECFYDNHFYCEWCGDAERIDNGIRCGDEMYCEDCAERRLYHCEKCGEWNSEGLTEVEGCREVCNNCLEDYSYCDKCDTYCLETDYINDENVCSNCRDEHYEKCDECGEYYEKEEKCSCAA